MSSSKPGSSGIRRVPRGLSRYLASGVRSTHDVLAYLVARGAAPRDAARIVSAYASSGILDDRVCARLCAGHWARRGYAASAIRTKLAEKGLPSRLIDEAIRIEAGPENEERRARALATPRRGSSPRERTRLARRLTARGFDEALIERVLGEAVPSISDAES